MTSEQARDLLQRYRLGVCSDEEVAALEEWYERQANLGDWEWTAEARQVFSERLRQGIEAELQEEGNGVVPMAARGRGRRIGWRGVTAAAAVILVVGAAALYMLARGPQTKPNTVAAGPAVHTDVAAPVSSHATITLAGGQRLVLDSVANGQLATQGNARLVKKADGQLVYNGVGNAPSEVLYNTLTVPRGSRIVTITLSDGTRVWLNSESSLRYPTTFTGKERNVAINGEAYFEVAKNAASPFLVSNMASDVQVLVLGTSFNINGYSDEKAIRVTLLEGSVRVKKGAQSSPLTPGRQAEVGERIRVVEGINTEAVMAWKNGYFHFDQADIQTVMRQLARWYDLDVQYEGAVPDRRFGGEMDRDLPLSGVLRLLQQGKIHYRVEGKRVTVTP